MLNTQTLSDAADLAGTAQFLPQLEGCNHLKIYFKPHKVTASARFAGRSIGARGSSLPECLKGLIGRLQELRRSQ